MFSKGRNQRSYFMIRFSVTRVLSWSHLEEGGGVASPRPSSSDSTSPRPLFARASPHSHTTPATPSSQRPPKPAPASHGKAARERDVAWLPWGLPPVRPGQSSRLLGQPNRVPPSPGSVPKPARTLWQGKRRLISRKPCLGALVLTAGGVFLSLADVT